MSLIVDEHRQYLADTARLDAFASALRALIRPSDVVLDLASGTGILGLLACQAGAARVYAIEVDAIVELARDIARDNAFGDRLVFIHDMSTRAVLPERVDLIVTDGAGRFGFDAGMLETLTDARRRFLKPGGRTIPSALALWLAPVEAPDVREQVDFWMRPIRGLSFTAAHAIAQSTGYPRQLSTEELLAEPVTLTTIDLAMEVNALGGNVAFTIARPGILHGIGGGFVATLAPGIELTNLPGARGRIARRNVFFPLRQSVAVTAGERVQVSMSILPASLVVSWAVTVRDAGSGRVRHTSHGSTFEGMLISREDMARMRPGFKPTLTAAGRARQTVLELCDGARALADVEAEVYRRHRELFSREADAAAFVAEVVTRYTT